MKEVWVLPTSTLGPLGPSLQQQLLDRGIPSTVTVTPYGEFDRELLDPGSRYNRFRADLTVLIPDTHDLLAPAFEAPITTTDRERTELVDHAVARVSAAVYAASRNSKEVLLCNGTFPPKTALGFMGGDRRLSPATLVFAYNDRIAALGAENVNVTLVDYAGLVLAEGYDRWHDPRLWAHARMRLSRDGVDALASALARVAAATERQPCKCLVLDLDNTLWGGVLGEQGIDGIQVGGEGIGAAFVTFQRELLELRARGVLLAIASKNDHDDAMRAIEHHPGMLLRRHHLAAVQIGWQPKAQSIRAIAETLGFSTNALAFVDDSAHEREAVRQELPDVAVVDLPADPADYVAALRAFETLDVVRVTDEDRARNAMVVAEGARAQLRESSVDVEAFLRSLEQVAVVSAVDDATIGRAAQLSQRTNQFNLTLRRLDAASIRRAIDAGALALLLRAIDRLGDSGLVAFALATRGTQTGSWELDTFVLSCRVIGRGYDTALLSELVGRLRNLGCSELSARFVPGPRNSVCATFLADRGFVALEPNAYHLDLRKSDVTFPDYIVVRRESP